LFRKTFPLSPCKNILYGSMALHEKSYIALHEMAMSQLTYSNIPSREMFYCRALIVIGQK